MMSVRIAVETEQCLVGTTLQLKSLGFDVLGLHIHSSIVKLKDGNVAIAIEWNVIGMRWNERIAHDSIEVAIDLLWDFAEYN